MDELEGADQGRHFVWRSVCPGPPTRPRLSLRSSGSAAVALQGHCGGPQMTLCHSFWLGKEAASGNAEKVLIGNGLRTREKRRMRRTFPQCSEPAWRKIRRWRRLPTIEEHDLAPEADVGTLGNSPRDRCPLIGPKNPGRSDKDVIVQKQPPLGAGFVASAIASLLGLSLEVDAPVEIDLEAATGVDVRVTQW